MSWRDRFLELLGLKSAPTAPEPEAVREAPVQSSAEPPSIGESAGSTAREVPVQPRAELPARRRRVTVVIGLDFGTSCTKCVIGVAGRAIAVPFHSLTSAQTPYLLSTELWVGSDRSLNLHKSENARSITGMKVGLMEDPDTPALSGGNEGTPTVLAAAYIGEVLRHARSWLLAEKKDLLGDAVISWQLNVGLPAKSHDDSGIHKAFQRAVRAGWALSQWPGTTNLGVAAEAVLAVSDESKSLSGVSGVYLIPEVAAGVVGYARSAQRRAGPHLMVDVGATTVDVCMFQLSQEEDGYRYAFYATDVRTDLGALRLHTKRRKVIDPSASGLGLNSPLDPIPASYRDYRGANGAVEDVDRWFGDETERTVRVVAWRAKQKQRSGLVLEVERQRGIERVKEGEIRVLMCGGGSRVPLYIDAVKEAGRALGAGGKTGLLLKPFGIVPHLEFPQRLDAPGLPRSEFHRVAVAYGLSYSVDNIGRFIPPSEIEPEPRRWLVEFEDSRPGND